MATPNLVDFSGSLEELKEKITSHDGLVVVKFGSTTCMPCKRVRQILPGIATDNPSVLFLNVEVDQNRAIGEAFGITSVPNMKYFKGKNDAGEPIEVASIIGAQIPQIKEAIKKHT